MGCGGLAQLCVFLSFFWWFALLFVQPVTSFAVIFAWQGEYKLALGVNIKNLDWMWGSDLFYWHRRTRWFHWGLNCFICPTLSNCSYHVSFPASLSTILQLFADFFPTWLNPFIFPSFNQPHHSSVSCVFATDGPRTVLDLTHWNGFDIISGNNVKAPVTAATCSFGAEQHQWRFLQGSGYDYKSPGVSPPDPPTTSTLLPSDPTPTLCADVHASICSLKPVAKHRFTA